MAKKKSKKAKAPKVVAPEPRGDEWEANLRWDRVARGRGAPPAFFNGAHVATTERVFEVPYDLREEQPRSLAAAGRELREARALDAFLAAEGQLRAAREQRGVSREALRDMQELLAVERAEAQQEEAEARERLSQVYSGVGEGLEGTEAALQRQEAEFFARRERSMARLLDLLLHDSEIEDLFAERAATLRECEAVIDAYYEERGVHVRAMEQLQAEHAAEREAEAARMSESLKRAADELVIASLERETNQAVEDTHTQLLDELLKLHARSAPAERRVQEMSGGAAELRRLVDLERQRLALATSRGAALRRSVAALRAEEEEKAHARSRTLDATSGAVAPLSAGGDAINRLAQLRRQLDGVTHDLAAARDRHEALQRYSLLQLRGQYKPVNLTADTFRTTESVLDPETNAAVRNAVLEGLASVSDALRPVCHAPGGGAVTVGAEEEEEPLAELSLAQTLEDRKMVQNYVVRKINNLFTTRCPTAPSLALLPQPQS